MSRSRKGAALFLPLASRLLDAPLIKLDQIHHADNFTGPISAPHGG